ncbi:hypothetical protein [Saccharopolyspora hattusasensis]|uniref:hypothetical protein n=1 Tax=Saccharopolyspora hattusasensis TaxID=1128679 RepID=UPI003D950CEE
MVTLLWPDEVRPLDADLLGEPPPAVREQERDMATQLVTSMSADTFDLDGYQDTYRQTLGRSSKPRPPVSRSRCRRRVPKSHSSWPRRCAPASPRPGTAAKRQRLGSDTNSDWMSGRGWPIRGWRPAEDTEVHGVSADYACHHGRDAAVVVAEVAAALAAGCGESGPGSG